MFLPYHRPLDVPPCSLGPRLPSLTHPACSCYAVQPGDLKFVIRQPHDARWERRGNDLIVNETISLVDALTGFKRELVHLDGHKFTIGVEVGGDWRGGGRGSGL